MSKRWFFGMSGRDVHLQARAEGPGGSDAYHTVRPGEKFLGFSYDASLRVAFCILRPRPMFLLASTDQACAEIPHIVEPPHVPDCGCTSGP